MRTRVLLIIGATLIVTVLIHYLYSMPEQVGALFYRPVAARPGDAEVYLMVRNCERYARRTGNWWWKRIEVDYAACADDPGTAGVPKVIGALKQSGNSPTQRLLFTLACVSCKGARRLNSVTVPSGVSGEKGPAVFNLPENLRLSQEDLLQLLYSTETDAEVTQPIRLPEVE